MFELISSKMHRCLLIFALLIGLSFKSVSAKTDNHLDAELNNNLDLPTGPVVLVVTGNIQKTNIGVAAHFDMDMLFDLPKHTLYTSTLVTDGVKRFDGVWVRDLLDLLNPLDKTTIVVASALNDYAVSIPLTDFYDYDVLLATHMDGVQLLPTDKGPLWIVYPRDSLRKLQDIRYDYRWVWQLNHLDLR